MIEEKCKVGNTSAKESVPCACSAKFPKRFSLALIELFLLTLDEAFLLALVELFSLARFLIGSGEIC